MFNLSGSEIIVILLLALVVLGPDKLPDAMRKAGRTFAELKKLSSGFQDEVRKGFEEPVKEVKKTAASVRSAATFKGVDTTSVKDKPRYNPAVDTAPELPEGASVAEPLAAETPPDETPAEIVAAAAGPGDVGNNVPEPEPEPEPPADVDAQADVDTDADADVDADAEVERRT